jgi:hypothetical protein
MESMALELKNMFVLEIGLQLVFTVELKKSERMILDRFVFCPNPSSSGLSFFVNGFLP